MLITHVNYFETDEIFTDSNNQLIFLKMNIKSLSVCLTIDQSLEEKFHQKGEEDTKNATEDKYTHLNWLSVKMPKVRCYLMRVSTMHPGLGVDQMEDTNN